ncbi:hypothetical protein EDEG_02701 [Edhazardia aedis USNM 41457]|uniref:Uncharacterized protein n=1 Tax=Edhazardia aedis (strain USNM 41457) TaxID=1003232 RepID=J9D5T6_EDHAE|nr:hypothetical protein EDEG_02701 [Edhazardia aedis USNM 41457]|eukprot:EJW02909.1 hypothetical protein EDEG_02701 [Edhazardia aedis USNM 41457]
MYYLKSFFKKKIEIVEKPVQLTEVSAQSSRINVEKPIDNQNSFRRFICRLNANDMKSIIVAISCAILIVILSLLFFVLYLISKGMNIFDLRIYDFLYVCSMFASHFLIYFLLFKIFRFITKGNECMEVLLSRILLYILIIFFMLIAVLFPLTLVNWNTN